MRWFSDDFMKQAKEWFDELEATVMEGGYDPGELEKLVKRIQSDAMEYAAAICGRQYEPQRQRPQRQRLFTDVFLRPVRELEKRGHIDAALDVLYDRVDGLLRGKQFVAVDDLLQHLRVNALSVDVLIGLLTSTLPARSKLPSRAKFYSEAEASIRQRGEWEEGLLTGLES